MLLALRNDRGTVAGGTMYPQAAGGAILAELLLHSRVRAVKDGRSTFVVIDDRTPLGNAVLDECLEKIATAKRRATVATWVQRFSGLRRLKHRVAESLVDKGVLRATEESVLLFFKRRTYPELDPSVEQRILARLEDAVFSDSSVVDPRTTVLIALAHQAGLLKANFARARLKTRRTRIKAIIAGDVVGQATKAAIEAVHVAVMMAAVMPAIIASSHS